MTTFIHSNGLIIDAGDFRICPDNRGFRYGDGLFETMKVRDGEILLEALHFERLFSSLRLLRFDIPEYFTDSYVREQVGLLLEKNGHRSLARVRLMVYRGDGGLYDSADHRPQLLIQSWPLQEQIAGPGLQIDIFPDSRKACDLFSGIKSNNYLCYSMGALFAKRHALDDALILNHFNRVSETTIANIFIVIKGLIKTPPLTEGCVNGVYRRYLLQCFIQHRIEFVEEAVTVEMMLQADEVFITNAITGIRSVQRCREVVYGSETTVKLQALLRASGVHF
ncbi:MAG: aminotransferase class IV [Chitinophagaceae bacterium]